MSSLLQTAPAGGAAPIRVMIVDDSALMRKLLSEILSQAPGIEVIGTARDGEDALEKVSVLHPDVITLDVEMPRLDGVGFLEALMQKQPTRVVMISSLTTAGAETTMACLQRGAIDFVAKPSGSISLDIARCGQDIVEKVRLAATAKICPIKPPRFPGKVSAADTPRSASPLSSAEKMPLRQGGAGPTGLSGIKASPGAEASGKSVVKNVRAMDSRTVVVAIASSTGGPAALQELIPRLPADLNAAYLIVQHLPAGFTRSMAERLNGASALMVREAVAGDVPQQGLVLIAPGGYHLELDPQGRVRLNEDPPLWGVRPAADVMMRSVAARFSQRAVGVVLTGMGRDGALGIKAIHQAGGFGLAQDETSSVVYGMPRAAVETGAVSSSVSLAEMANTIAQRVARTTGQQANIRAA